MILALSLLLAALSSYALAYACKGGAMERLAASLCAALRLTCRKDLLERFVAAWLAWVASFALGVATCVALVLRESGTGWPVFTALPGPRDWGHRGWPGGVLVYRLSIAGAIAVWAMASRTVMPPRRQVLRGVLWSLCVPGILGAVLRVGAEWASWGFRQVTIMEGEATSHLVQNMLREESKSIVLIVLFCVAWTLGFLLVGNRPAPSAG